MEWVILRMAWFTLVKNQKKNFLKKNWSNFFFAILFLEISRLNSCSCFTFVSNTRKVSRIVLKNIFFRNS